MPSCLKATNIANNTPMADCDFQKCCKQLEGEARQQIVGYSAKPNGRKDVISLQKRCRSAVHVTRGLDVVRCGQMCRHARLIAGGILPWLC